MFGIVHGSEESHTMKSMHIFFVYTAVFVPLILFCAKAPTDPISPENAHATILLTPISGNEIECTVAFHLGYFIDSVVISIYSDSAPDGNAAVDSQLVLRYGPYDAIDTMHYTFEFSTSGMRYFVVETFNHQGYTSRVTANAQIIAPESKNHPPRFITNAPKGTYRFNEGELVQFPVSAQDIDGDSVTYTYLFESAPLPRASTVTFRDNYFRWQSSGDDKGIYPVIFTASDGDTIVSFTTTLVIGTVDFNSPPEITTTPPVTAFPGKQYEYHPEAVDDSSAEFDWRLEGELPRGMNFNATNGSILWKPDSGAVSTGILSLIVFDRGTPPKSDTQLIQIIIGGNQPPVALPRNVATELGTPVEIQMVVSDPDDSVFTFIITATPHNGTAHLTVSNMVTYTPAAEFKGIDTIRVAVFDDAGGSDTAMIRIYVALENQKPVATGQQLSTNEDIPLYLQLKAEDVESDSLTFIILSQPRNGVMSGTSTSKHRVYTPFDNFAGTDTVSFIVNDGQLDSDPAMVIITVSPVNDTPFVVNLGVPTAVNTPVSITLTVIDPDDSVFTFEITDGPRHGSIDVNRIPELEYTPSTGFTGTDTVYVRATDAHALTGPPARIVIETGTANTRPTAVSQTVTVSEDGSTEIILSGSDAEQSTLTYTVLQQPGHGRITGNAPSLVYYPASDYWGKDTLLFTVSDGVLVSEPGTVAVTVEPVNDAPWVQSQSVATDLNTTATIYIAVTDIDDSVFTYRITSGTPMHGTLDSSSLAAGRLQYTPASEYKGPDTIRVSVLDAAGWSSNTATISISVASDNQPPTANEQRDTIYEDQTTTIFLTGSDIESSNLTFTITGNPVHGRLEGSLPNISYRPTQNFSGVDTFWFSVNDGSLQSDPASVIITILAVNDAPTAVPKSATTDLNTSVAVSLEAVDVDDASFIYRIISQPQHGSVDTSMISQGQITYTPENGFKGSDTLYYIAFDDEWASDAPARIVIGVALDNQPPVANPQWLLVNEDESLPITLSGSDLEGSPLSFSISVLPAHGQINGTPPSVTYVPSRDFYGFDSFTFMVRDNELLSSEAVIYIMVTSVNDAPTATRQSIATALNTALSTTLSGADVDDDQLTFTVTDFPSHGSLDTSNISQRRVYYTPGTDFKGLDTITYNVRDPQGAESGPTLLIIGVALDNQPPVAIPQTVTTNEDVPTSIVLTGSDIEHSPLTFSIVNNPEHGVLTKTSGANYTFYPEEDYNGTVAFTFKANDGMLDSDPAEVTITIRPVNDAPVALPTFPDVPEDTPTPFTLGATDVDGDALTFTITSPPSHGDISNVPDGTYSPDENYFGSDEFTFIASDGFLEDTATVDVTVTPVNDPPVADPQSGVPVDEDGAITITLTGSDIDDDDNDLTFDIDAQPAHGTVDLTGSSAEYQPNPDYDGTDSFTFTASDDDEATSAPATISLTVTAINDTPVIDDIPDQSIPMGGSFAPISLDDYVNDVDNSDDEIEWSTSATTNITVEITARIAEITVESQDWVGSESVTFTATDTGDLSAATEVAFTVTNSSPTITGIDDRVIAVNGTTGALAFTIDDEETSPGSLDVTAVSSNQTVVPDSNITLGGTGGSRTISIVPATDERGTSTISVTVSDGLSSTVETFDLTVNAAPTAYSDSHNLDGNAPYDFELDGSDPEGGDLDFITTSDPVNGEIAKTLDSVLTYTPDNGFTGSDSFSFIVADPYSFESDTATVTLYVHPVANDTSVTVTKGGSVVFTLYGSDPELDFSKTSDPDHGTLDDATIPEVMYTHDNSEETEDSFTFTVSDGELTSDTATVTITITPE